MDLNCISSLNFYDGGTDIHRAIDRQNYRRERSVSAICPIDIPLFRMIPFQFSTSFNADNFVDVAVLAVSLVDANTNEFTPIKTQMVISGLRLVEVPGKNYYNIVYKSSMDASTFNKSGSYYLTITLANANDDYNFFVSDIFNIVDVSRHVMLEWWDYQDLHFSGGSVLYYGGTFHNKLYIKSALMNPKYTFEETGEDRDGIFFKEKQIAKKIHSFSFKTCEGITDVMRVVRVSDNIVVKYDWISYVCDSFSHQIEWDDNTGLATVKIEFSNNTIIKKIANFVPPEPPNNGAYDDSYDDGFDNTEL